jgi:hypothetical protein
MPSSYFACSATSRTSLRVYALLALCLLTEFRVRHNYKLGFKLSRNETNFLPLGFLKILIDVRYINKASKYTINTVESGEVKTVRFT